MELLQLKYFKAVADNGNITHTAKRLFISPSALSTSIHRLEKEIGVTLFDRKGRNIYLNERGKIFLTYVDTMLSALTNAVSHVTDMDNRPTHKLSVAALSLHIWHNLIKAFNMKNPEIILTYTDVKIDEFHTDDLINRYNFLLADPRYIDSKDLNYTVLYDDDYPMLAVYPGHPLANRQTVRFQELKDEPFLVFPKGHSSRYYFDDLCKQAGVFPHIVAECNNDLRYSMLAAGHGLVLTSAGALARGDLKGYPALKITEPKYRCMQALLWHKNCYQSKSAELFRDFALAAYREGFRSNME